MDPFAKVIAGAYERAPVMASGAQRAWHRLADLSKTQAAALRKRFVIEVTAGDMPYHNVEGMFEDLSRGRFVVSSANAAHPLWTATDQINFRIVHDILGHFQAHLEGDRADFSWEGEQNAYSWHQRILPADELRNALFTEVLGQAAYAAINGRFGDQKVAFL